MASVDGSPTAESTFTSLMASSGRLRSSLYPEPFSPIKYKDRHYESASAALDAYIADFQTSESSVGRLELAEEQNKPCLVQSGYRNRDVLKESLTDRELNFLNLPVASKHRSDHVSVTTDDLLMLPVDGSLPVTRTSALLCRLGSNRLWHSPNSSRRSPSRPVLARNKSQNSSSSSRTLCVEDLLTGSSKSERLSLHLNSVLQETTRNKQRSLSSHHLPRWMTSQKSEMDFSGVTSIPDLKYPAWLELCGVRAEPRSVPSWIGELEKNPDEGLVEAESYKNVESGGGYMTCDRREHFRGDKIDSLIQRAEEVLKSPSLGFCSSDKEQHGSPGHTEDLLEAERSWDNPPVTFKSPVPVESAEEPITAEELEDAREKYLGSLSSGYSSRKHPGPVEALKQMLYSLQTVEQKVTQQKDEFSPLTPIKKDNEEVPHPDDYDSSPGGQSLKRALHHLGRLKSLVDEMNERKAGESHQPRVQNET